MKVNRNAIQLKKKEGLKLIEMYMVLNPIKGCDEKQNHNSRQGHH